jgi:hypothetical protein
MRALLHACFRVAPHASERRWKVPGSTPKATPKRSSIRIKRVPFAKMFYAAAGSATRVLLYNDICGNPADDLLPGIRGMADTVVPQEKSSLRFQ